MTNLELRILGPRRKKLAMKSTNKATVNLHDIDTWNHENIIWKDEIILVHSFDVNIYFEAAWLVHHLLFLIFIYLLSKSPFFFPDLRKSIINLRFK
jgi:hypothetical protein